MGLVAISRRFLSVWSQIPTSVNGAEGKTIEREKYEKKKKEVNEKLREIKRIHAPPPTS